MITHTEIEEAIRTMLDSDAIIYYSRNPSGEWECDPLPGMGSIGIGGTPKKAAQDAMSKIAYAIARDFEKHLQEEPE